MEQDDPNTYASLVGFEGDWRDQWHNEDFLALMARRWRLSTAQRLLDVGCGVGHWGQRLAPYLAAEATLVGVDREARFLVDAGERARARGLADRSTWLQGDVTDLPFDDDHFDVVTCQTVLMHLEDPAAAVREMARVARPGGLVCAVEPSNLMSAFFEWTEDPDVTDDELLDMLRFERTVHRGKIALGQGDSSIGPRLPGLFADAGLVELQAHQGDRCAVTRPPYEGPARRDVDQRLAWIDGEALAGGTRADTRERFLAAGGDDASFERLYSVRRAHDERLAERMRDKTWWTTGAYAMVFTAGRKPA